MFVLFWLLACASALAQGQPLTHDDVVRAVLDHNPALHAARARARLAATDPAHAPSWDDPVLDASVAPLTFAQPGTTPGVVVGLTQKVPPLGSIASHHTVAHLHASSVQLEVDALDIVFAVNAATVYASVWQLDRTLEALHEHERLMDDVIGTLRARYETGQASLADVLEAEAEAMDIGISVVGAKAERTAAKAALNGLMSRSATDGLTVAEGLPTRTPAPAVDRLEVRAARRRVASAEALAVSAHRDNGSGFSVMARYSTMWQNPGHRLMVGGAFALPVYRGERRARILAAAESLSLAKADLQSVEDTVFVEVVAAQALYDGALATVQLREERHTLAQRRLTAVRDAYITDRTPLSAVLRAARGAIEAELDVARAQAQVHVRACELDGARGRLPLLDVNR